MIDIDSFTEVVKFSIAEIWLLVANWGNSNFLTYTAEIKLKWLPGSNKARLTPFSSLFLITISNKAVAKRGRADSFK